MKLKIIVTEEDIRKGSRGQADTCPIAYATCRALGVNRVYVDSEYLCYATDSCSLPDEATEFIRRFDTGMKVKPFEFEIEIQI